MTELTLHRGPCPGLIGEIAATHGRYYAREWGFGAVFEAKVAWDCAEFMLRAGEDDLILSASAGDRFAGSLILDTHDPEAPGLSHLRWFIVTDAAGGRGLGRRLMGEAMTWLDTQDLGCFLTTFAGLDVARRLYEAHGFHLTHEDTGETWGSPVTEQRFDRPAASAHPPRT